MGLVGLLVTVLIMVVGAGYYLFGFSHPSGINVTNGNTQTAAAQNGITNEMAALDAAKAAVNQAEQKTTNDVGQKAGDVGQAADSQGGGKQLVAGSPAIIDRLVPFGFSVPQSPRAIDTIVLHSSCVLTGNDPYSVDGVIAEWKSYGVAPHYLIDRNGTVYRLVVDADIAYHAGASKMPDGRTNVNDFSIGIELLDTKTDKYTDAQYASVNALIAMLKGKYGIKNVVGHNDIAPGRKTDPWNFDWKRVR